MVQQMWRVAAAFRLVTLVYAGALILGDHDRYTHPAAGLAALLVLVVWSAVTVAAYARPAGRRPWLIAADVAVAVVLVIATRWVDTGARIDHGAATLPTSWVASPVLACAVAGGPWAGLAGAAAVSVADLVERQALPQNTLNGVALLLITGVAAGYAVRLGTRAEAAWRGRPGSTRPPPSGSGSLAAYMIRCCRCWPW